jgi:acyl-coenzyme A synthetase/AMP-(fatty) acid ligase
VLEEIRKWADGQLAGYKRLRGGVFHLQTLPKTPTGKILRRLLPAKVKEGRGGRL